MLFKLKKKCDPAKAEISNSIIEILSKLIPDGAEAIAALNIFDQIEKPPEVAMGDFSMPCFRFARLLKKKPQDIAEDLRRELQATKSEWIRSIEVVGAFLNFHIRKDTLAKLIIPRINDGSYFTIFARYSSNRGTKVMIEFSQPNTHKEFHVGHGRNVCLGDSLCRLFRYNDYDIIPVNYIGDEGTHIAKCLWQMDSQDESPPKENKSEWYGKRYVEATQKIEIASDDEKIRFNAQVSEILRSIESKSGKYYQSWVTSREECIADFKATYNWLEVAFDHYFYESEFSSASQEIVDEFLKNGYFKESNGAIGRDLSDFKLGFCMVRKSDGNIPYMTRDIALARKKFDDFGIDRSIYVVGSEQNYHFSQLFAVLKGMGFDQAKSCFHLSYGMVVLPEGKMSSRKGNSISFNSLRKTMLSELGEHLKRYEGEWDQEMMDETAHRLSVGAIKYGMLQSDPSREITFELKNWLSFEGNTGPYLMYTYARSRSILRKAADADKNPCENSLELLTQESEVEILRSLYDFNSVCQQACETYRPSILAQYLFSICKSFNRFYADVPIIKAESNELIGARLALLDAFGRCLREGLSLLGITPPERM